MAEQLASTAKYGWTPLHAAARGNAEAMGAVMNSLVNYMEADEVCVCVRACACLCLCLRRFDSLVLLFSCSRVLLCDGCAVWCLMLDELTEVVVLRESYVAVVCGL